MKPRRISHFLIFLTLFLVDVSSNFLFHSQFLRPEWTAIGVAFVLVSGWGNRAYRVALPAAFFVVDVVQTNPVGVGILAYLAMLLCFFTASKARYNGQNRNIFDSAILTFAMLIIFVFCKVFLIAAIAETGVNSMILSEVDGSFQMPTKNLFLLALSKFAISYFLAIFVVFLCSNNARISTITNKTPIFRSPKS